MGSSSSSSAIQGAKSWCRPSYPLFEFLPSLEGVVPVSYPLRFDGTWHIDFGALQAAVTPRTRAVVVVHPNNPTGSYVAPEDRERLLALGLPVIVDEVFLDFPLTRKAAPSFAGSSGGMVFVLSGLSKIAGLPQMKLGWIGIAGDPQSREEAGLRLEHIADAYLSVGAPVQVAAPALFELGARTRRSISERTLRNLDSLRTALGSAPAVTLLTPEGGWYAPLRVPGVRSSEEWALLLLEKESVYVHPGSFFGFETEAFLVLSLLSPDERFDDGLHRIVRATRV
jgi:aspartate/methionine/tyrosine aminotransferase